MMKMTASTFQRMVAIAVVAATLAIVPGARADSITATVDSPNIALGQSVQLTVTVSGTDAPVSIPKIPGLDIVDTGQFSQTEIYNGSVSATISNTYEITPQREGTFTIPALRAGNATSQPVTLQVGNGAGAPGAAAPPATPNPALPAAPMPADAEDGAAPQMGNFGSIQMTLPKKNFYVGELVPVEIKAYVPEGASIEDLPQFTSDGFTLDTLSTKPDESQQMIDGQPYGIYTWHSALTAVKSGDYPVTLSMPETVMIRQELQVPDDSDDIFGSFFKNAMASMGGVKKEVKLQSAAQTLKVLPIPAAGRPADFSGAVGQFEIESSAAPTQVNAGDPITLRLKVTGKGNFDRVSPGLLASDAHWKSYATKSRFAASDSNGYEGTKTFEQPIIPNAPGAATVPAISFSYFDPATGSFVTRTASPIAVTVTGTPVSAAMASTAPAVTTANPGAASSNAGDAFRPNKVETGAFVATLRPIYLSPWFLAGQGLPVAALLAGLALVRRGKNGRDPQRARATAAQRAIREQVAAMDEAMRRSETGAFFVHARNAFQQRLGEKWNVRPETITLADVQERLVSGQEAIAPVFEMADQASYSDLHFDATDLRDWRHAILRELQLVEKN